MKKNYLWTKSKARLLLISSNNKSNYNWVFIPGGPGLGSEYLDQLTNLLFLPGSIWHFDFPGDGSNIITDNAKPFKNWPKALIEAICALNNVILVTHSFSGMFALTMPELENLITGLVLMDAAPNKSWQKCFQQYQTMHPLPEAEKKLKIYNKKRSNNTLKDFVIAGATYCVCSKGLKRYISIARGLSFNYKAYEWHTKNFHPTYKAKWVPKKIPTLIFAGDSDHITPLSLFMKIKKFRRKTISIAEIKNAGHYPWIENPRQVIAIFKKYSKKLPKAV